MPTVGNLGGFAVLSPPGGQGCSVNLAACYPQAYATVGGWLSALQAAYESPAAVMRYDVFAPASAAVVDALALKWQTSVQAGLDMAALDAAARAALIAAALPATQAAGAAGAAVATSVADAVSGSIDAAQVAAADGKQMVDDALQAAINSLRG